MKPRAIAVKACVSFGSWSQEVTEDDATYVVRLSAGRDPRVGVGFSYSCGCKEFLTEPGTCLHVLLAKGDHCGWHQAFDPEVMDAGRTCCPRCGGPLMDVILVP
jgi:hypothetical protein